MPSADAMMNILHVLWPRFTPAPGFPQDPSQDLGTRPLLYQRPPRTHQEIYKSSQDSPPETAKKSPRTARDPPKNPRTFPSFLFKKSEMRSYVYL